MISQGTFARLPDLDEDDIKEQIRYAISNSWAISVEYTDDPHPRNVFWDLWGLPMFDLSDPGEAFRQVRACCEQFPHHYVKVNAFDASAGRETTALSFLVQRPLGEEPGFLVERQHGPGRTSLYSLKAYATEQPGGKRYQ
jgi:ribulose-bisphosphate carboxylase small chain